MLPNIVRVLLADAHPFVHTAVQSILAETDDLRLVVSVNSLNQIEDSNRIYCPHIILLASNIAESSPLQSLDHLKQDCPKAKVLLLLDAHEKVCIASLIKQEAAGCISKQSSHTQLTEAIRAIANGNQWIDPILINNIFDPDSISIHLNMENRLMRKKYYYMLLGAFATIFLFVGIMGTIRFSEASFEKSPPSITLSKTSNRLDLEQPVLDIESNNLTQVSTDSNKPDHSKNDVQAVDTTTISPSKSKLLVSHAEELTDKWVSNLKAGWYHKVETSFVAQLSETGDDFQYLDADGNEITILGKELNHGETTMTDSWYYIDSRGHLVEGFTLFMDTDKHIFTRTVYADKAWYNESLNLVYALSPAEAWQSAMPEYDLRQSLPSLTTDTAVSISEEVNQARIDDSQFHLQYSVAYEPYELGVFTFSATRYQYIIDENSGQILSVSQELLDKSDNWITNYRTETIQFNYSETLPIKALETLGHLKEVKINHAQ